MAPRRAKAPASSLNRALAAAVETVLLEVRALREAVDGLRAMVGNGNATAQRSQPLAREMATYDCPDATATPSIPRAATAEVVPGSVNECKQEVRSEGAPAGGNASTTSRLREAASVPAPDSCGRKLPYTRSRSSASKDSDDVQPWLQKSESSQAHCVAVLEDDPTLSPDGPLKFQAHRRSGPGVEVSARGLLYDNRKAAADSTFSDAHAQSARVSPTDCSTATRCPLAQSLEPVAHRPLPRSNANFDTGNEVASFSKGSSLGPVQVTHWQNAPDSCSKQLPLRRNMEEAERIGTELTVLPELVGCSPSGNVKVFAVSNSAASTAAQPQPRNPVFTELSASRDPDVRASGYLSLRNHFDEKARAKSTSPIPGKRILETAEFSIVPPISSAPKVYGASSPFLGDLGHPPFVERNDSATEIPADNLMAVDCLSPSRTPYIKQNAKRGSPSENQARLCAMDLSNAIEYARSLAFSRPVQALSQLLDHARSTSVEAMVTSAELLCGGKYGTLETLHRDPIEAIYWLDHALSIDPSCAKALVLRGEMARVGLGCERNLKLAVSMLRKSMELGNVEGQYRLGHSLVASCVDLPTLDERQRQCRLGKTLLEEALDLGEGRAGVALGHWYENSDDLRDAGITDVFEDSGSQSQNEKTVFKCYERAASFGTPAGLNNVGTCFATGFAGLRASFDIALEYFIRAWEAGSLDAGNNAGLLFESGAGNRFPERRDMVKAIEWYERGYKLGHGQSTLHLANAYDDGNGVHVDIAKAEMLYLRAREFAIDNDDDYVCSLVLHDLVALYLSQSILDVTRSDMWTTKLLVLLGRAAAKDRRCSFRDLLSCAAEQMLLLHNGVPEITDSDTTGVGGGGRIENSAVWHQRELLRLVGEVNTRQLLQTIGNVIKQLAGTDSHSVGGSIIAAYRYLSLSIGEARARSIWDLLPVQNNFELALSHPLLVAENTIDDLRRRPAFPNGERASEPRVKRRKLTT